MNIETAFYSILCSVIASFIFLFLVLFFFKPKLKISPIICKGKHIDGDDTDYYFIKLINTSIFSAYDVSIELLEVDRYPIQNGHMNSRFRPLNLVLNRISHIAGYKPSWLRKNAPYAIKIRTTENLNSILANSQKSVMVQVSLRHGLTGLVKIHSKEYIDTTQIKNGKFEYGKKFGTIN